MLYEDITQQIIGAAQEVHRQLGYGFLEAVYGNALFQELTGRGMNCECQKKIDVFYKGKPVGFYVADMIVADKVIVELKAARDIRPEHLQQLLNYLVATRMEVGLLLNFGHSMVPKRVIHTLPHHRQ